MVVDNPSRFIEKYTTKSPRLSNWNYSTPGIYFVTICTLNHNNFFGKIGNDKIILSYCGQIAQQCLLDIPKHFLQIDLDNFVIMPNHLHILFRIKTPISKSVETRDRASLQKGYQSFHFHRLAIKSNQILPKIINQYKSSVKRICNQQHLFFSWQSRFHDEIIKTRSQFLITRRYIQNNIVNWEKDKFYR